MKKDPSARPEFNSEKALRSTVAIDVGRWEFTAD